MIRQPDSLDSVEGEQTLPYDTVPLRLDQTGAGGTNISYYTSIFVISTSTIWTHLINLATFILYHYIHRLFMHYDMDLLKKGVNLLVDPA